VKQSVHLLLNIFCNVQDKSEDGDSDGRKVKKSKEKKEKKRKRSDDDDGERKKRRKEKSASKEKSEEENVPEKKKKKGMLILEYMLCLGKVSDGSSTDESRIYDQLCGMKLQRRSR
tara:strand:- start:3282 stop:3629 length:348 start_codon:yes stop_codon:yes gene_type:complete